MNTFHCWLTNTLAVNIFHRIFTEYSLNIHRIFTEYSYTIQIILLLAMLLLIANFLIVRMNVDGRAVGDAAVHSGGHTEAVGCGVNFGMPHAFFDMRHVSSVRIN